MSAGGRPANSPREGVFFVPCGKCVYCLVRRRQEWVLRLMCELNTQEHYSFVTLTYNDDNTPKNGSLVKKDLQLYFKRLRKRYVEKIKYYACGEYGDKTFRPHYHFIIFGIRCLCSKGHCHCPIEEEWNKGFVYCGSVTSDSIRYVAQYIDKKRYGQEAKNEYERTGREPIFQLQSKRLGLEYFKKNIDDISKKGYIQFNEFKQAIPRYFQKQLSEEWRRENQQKAKIKQVEMLREHFGDNVQSEYEDLEMDMQFEVLQFVKSEGEKFNRDMVQRLKINKAKGKESI